MVEMKGMLYNRSNIKEVNMKNFIALFFIFTLLFSLNTFAKDSFSFEPEEYQDSIIPPGIEGLTPFTTGYRDSRPEDFSVVEGEESWHGTHAVQIRMTHEGTRWLLFCKNAFINPQEDSFDTTFLQDLDNGDTIYYYLYIPSEAPIDSIFMFMRNQDWEHDEHTVYHSSDLVFGAWNELKDGISDSTDYWDTTFTLPVIQSDFQIDTYDSVATPACTLYWDCPSSLGPVAGIDMPEQRNNAVSVVKNSINCVRYTLNAGKPVIVQIFDLTGRKMTEIVPGFQAAGSYDIDLSLSAGVYIARVVAGIEEETAKVICVK
jgi:hypothetical protein